MSPFPLFPSLFWRLANDPTAMLGVSAEAFDDADDLRLDRHVYIEAKPARYAFADDRPRLSEAQCLAAIGVTPAGDAEKGDIHLFSYSPTKKMNVPVSCPFP